MIKQSETFNSRKLVKPHSAEFRAIDGDSKNIFPCISVKCVADWKIAHGLFIQESAIISN